MIGFRRCAFILAHRASYLTWPLDTLLAFLSVTLRLENLQGLVSLNTHRDGFVQPPSFSLLGLERKG